MSEKTYFKLAMPPDVRAWLDKASKASGRSRTMHIIFLLRQEMDKEKALGLIAKQTPNASNDQ